MKQLLNGPVPFSAFDAWNRLVKLVDTASTNTVQQNIFDARMFLVNRQSFAGGTLSETRHCYFTSDWQSVEERIGTSPDSATPEQQQVWGQRYVDDIVLRDRDTTGGGTLDERLHGLQDSNWNTVAVIDTIGSVSERYSYSAYGTPVFLTASFAPLARSGLVWDFLYSGHRTISSDICLFDARNRILHPTTGFWLRRDPIGYWADSSNLYEYVSSSPLDSYDPFGLEEHTKGARPSTSDKHTKPRSGRPTTKQRQKPNWIKKQPRKRKGGCDRGFLKIFFLVSCEAACAVDFDDCVDSAEETHEFQLGGARNSEDITLANRVLYLSLAECGVVYTACGLACLVPVGLPGTE
ncbi:MAG: repeat-associated core domain protein [Schlesneria sp.]|nr:repeat-associated core domain protein [Schlesneria sp.]